MTEPLESTETGEREGGLAPDQGSPVTEAARELIERRTAEEREAAEARRGPGRPRGARDSRPRKRRGDARRPRPGAAEPELPADEPPAPEPPSEAELAGLGKAAENLWRVLACRFGGRRPLTTPEGREIAEAAAPVLAKYLGPAVERYGAEFALAMTVWGLWELTAPPPAPELERGADGAA